MKNKKCLPNNRFVVFARPALPVVLALFIFSCTAGENRENSGGSLSDTTRHFSATLIEEVINNDPQNEGVTERREWVDEVSRSRHNAITTAVEEVSPAIVSVTVTSVVEQRTTAQDEFLRYFFGLGGTRDREFTNMGSGFIISEDGLVVTNQHVIGTHAKEVVVATIDGTTYDARVIGSDEFSDLALVKINSIEPFPYVEFTDSEEVIVGEWAIALGNPFGLFEDGRPAVTVGVVSAKNRDFRPDPSNPRVYIDMIQTDAAINRGNSGGPLLNSEGRVMGVNTFIYTGGTGSGFIGLGFAIPSNRVEKIINQLLTSGHVVLDYDPGMEFTAMTEQLIYQHRLPYIQGLLVTSINKGGPAFECGVMPGDIILKIGEERVVSEMHAWALLREYDEGDRMKLQLLRDGQQYQTEMLLRQKVRGEEITEEE
ncbi:MAG: trypsin-like peptidase domain-containing protein [Balneolaceae bacterium]